MVLANFEAILRELNRHGVDFIVVGGLGAILQGSATSTFDVDVVHSTDPKNVERILPLLESLDAFYRIQPERRLRPNASHVSSTGHQSLITKFGSFDMLGHIGNGRTYEDLLNHTVEIDLGDGLKVRVLDLETLIAVKEEVGGEKDIAVLPVLRRTLAEKRRGAG
jgi:predicted nucleotidyltransferase